jgi:hypothetical protein
LKKGFSHTPTQSSSPTLAAVLETPSIAATVYPEPSQGSSVNYYSQTLNVPPPMPLPGQSVRAILFTLILLVILLLVIVLLYRTVVAIVYPKFQGRDTQSGSHLHPVDVKGDLYASERPQLMATIISMEGRISKLENDIKESKVQIRRAFLASERSNESSMVDRTEQHQPPNTHLNAAACGKDQGRKPEVLDTRQPTSTDYIPDAKDETTPESASKAKAKRVGARRGRTHDSLNRLVCRLRHDLPACPLQDLILIQMTSTRASRCAVLTTGGIQHTTISSSIRCVTWSTGRNSPRISKREKCNEWIRSSTIF